MGGRKLTRQRLALAAIVAVCVPALKDPARAAGPGPDSLDEKLYTPSEAEVRAEYQRDLSNQKVQTWREYWGWVQGFYRGNLLADGWTKYSQATLAKVKAEAERRMILTKINHLGKLISREWAKHDSVRKITSADLRRWHDAISEARRADDGTGHGITKAIDAIRAQAAKQLAG